MKKFFDSDFMMVIRGMLKAFMYAVLLTLLSHGWLFVTRTADNIFGTTESIVDKAPAANQWDFGG